MPDALVSMEKTEIEKLIDDFCYYKMEKKWKSPRTANTALFMLKTFFKVNGFKGNKKLELDCFHQSVRERTKPEYIPSLDEARRMANVAGSLRNRAMVFFLISTGLRNGTLRALLYGEVKKELEAGATNILIKIHKNMKRIVPSACKGNTEYTVFTSGEATEALRLFLNERRRFGEIQDEEVLFCSDHNRFTRKERSVKPLTPRELQVIIKNAARKAGVKEWKNVVPHSLRKTFESVLRSQLTDGGRLDLKTQEYFMGHILGGSMDTYYDKTKTEELRKEYAKLIFKPQEQAKVEIESLEAFASTLGIDYIRLEESKKKELGRTLNDSEKLIIVMDALKQTFNTIRRINSNPKTTIIEGGSDKISLNNQSSTCKTQLTPEIAQTTGALPPKISLLEYVKPGVSLSLQSAKTFTSPNENHKNESIPFSLGMMPKERTISPKQATVKRCKLELERKGESDLLQFLRKNG
jgi:integrase